MNISVSTLVIEIGRMCNLNCKHCLRGHSQNIKVSLDTAKHLIDQINYIGSIVFTGGEPALYGKEIAELVDYIIATDTSVESFYVASNGTFYNAELMNALITLYGYVDDKEMSAFELSTDIYHQESIDESGRIARFDPRFEAFSFFFKRGPISETAILREGNAEANGFGGRYPKHDMPFTYEVYSDNADVDMLYLTAKGYLAPHCDFSYNTYDELPLPQMDDINSAEDLIDSLQNYNDEI